MSIPRWIRRHVPKVGSNRSSCLTASQHIWICDPLKPPQNAPWVLWGDLYLAYVHSQMIPQTWTTVGANRSSRLTASPDFWICDTLTPPPPRNATWGIEGRLVFSLCPFPDESADGNQGWCQSDSFPILLNCWLPKTPQVPPLCLEGQFVWRIHSHMNFTCVPNLVPIGPAVW